MMTGRELPASERPGRVCEGMKDVEVEKEKGMEHGAKS